MIQLQYDNLYDIRFQYILSLVYSHYDIIQSLTNLSDINFAVNFCENFMSITYYLHYSSLNSHSVHRNDSFINECYLHSNKTSAKNLLNFKYSKN